MKTALSPPPSICSNDGGRGALAPFLPPSPSTTFNMMKKMRGLTFSLVVYILLVSLVYSVDGKEVFTNSFYVKIQPDHGKWNILTNIDHQRYRDSKMLVCGKYSVSLNIKNLFSLYYYFHVVSIKCMLMILSYQNKNIKSWNCKFILKGYPQRIRL